MDADVRLVRVPKNATIETNNGSWVTSRIIHKELASRAGTSRDMIVKIVKELRVGGSFSIENHRVHVHKDLSER